MFTGIFSVIGAIFGFGSTAVQSIANVKQGQTDLVKSTVEALSDANTSSAQKEAAIAQIITSEANSERWLTATWRPLVMVIFTIMIMAYFLGYTTENLLEPLPSDSAIADIFEIVKIGIMGYMPLRTFEKIATQINVGSIIKTLLNKSIVK